MRFELNDEQKMVRKMVREFAEKEIEPIADELDRTGKFPWVTLKKLAELSLMGITAPEEYGGAGLDSISYAIVIEEISKVCASTGVILSVHHSLVSYPLRRFGTETQKREYLVPMAQGKKLGAYALTEPNAGSDAGSLEMTAVLEGDAYVLNGTKTFITSGSEADIVLVFAMYDKSKGHRGISAFIVEKGTEGFTVGTEFEKLGIHAATTAELVFEDCKVPESNRLGENGEGFKVAMCALDAGRIGIGAQALGIAQGALDASIKYAKERKQFGKRIADFQAIQWMLADMATEIEAARYLLYGAAYAKDHKERYTKEAAMAKLFASEVAMRAATKAVQIYGGYGYIKDYPVERYFRDAKITEIYEGTSEIQRLVIAANILR